MCVVIKMIISDQRNSGLPGNILKSILITSTSSLCPTPIMFRIGFNSTLMFFKNVAYLKKNQFSQRL